MQTILEHTALAIGERRFDVADLVLVGHASGAWRGLERDLHAALSAAGGVDVPPEDLRAAASSFRVERGLISAADFKAWLAARSLSMEDLSGFLTRALTRGAGGHPDPAPQSSADLSATLRVEALCSGTLKRCAGILESWFAAELDPTVERDGYELDHDRLETMVQSALADEAAGLDALGHDELRERLGAILRAEAAHRRLGERVLEEGGLEDYLRMQRLEWLRIDGSELELAFEGAAREARLLVRDDGLSLDDVGGMLGLPPAVRSLYLDEAPTEVKPALASAEPGGIVGPWEEGPRWRLLSVREKTAPSAGDTVLRERARLRLLDAAVARLSAGRIRRHAAL